MMRYRRYGENAMEKYLAKLGLVLKAMPKDETSIFRAVSEQIYLTQKYHAEIRSVCQQYLDENEEDFLPMTKTHAIIAALSKLYKRDFMIYRELDKPPVNLTGNQFPDKVFLCESFGGHFDSIQKVQAQERQAVCQSIVYELLYNRVFRMKEEDLSGAVRLIRHRPYQQSTYPRLWTKTSECSPSGGSSEFESSGEHGKNNEKTSTPPLPSKPPFPFRIAKAMDPSIYRNIEYDAWLESRKDFFLRQQSRQQTLPYPPGTQCLVRWESNGVTSQVIVQDVSPDNERALVFVKDYGDMREVPVSSLQRLTIRTSSFSGPNRRPPPSQDRQFRSPTSSRFISGPRFSSVKQRSPRMTSTRTNEEVIMEVYDFVVSELAALGEDMSRYEEIKKPNIHMVNKLFHLYLDRTHDAHVTDYGRMSNEDKIGRLVANMPAIEEGLKHLEYPVEELKTMIINSNYPTVKKMIIDFGQLLVNKDELDELLSDTMDRSERMAKLKTFADEIEQIIDKATDRLSRPITSIESTEAIRARSPVRRRLFHDDNIERRAEAGSEFNTFGKPPVAEQGSPWTDSGYNASGALYENSTGPSVMVANPVNQQNATSWVWCQQPAQPQNLPTEMAVSPQVMSTPIQYHSLPAPGAMIPQYGEYYAQPQQQYNYQDQNVYGIYAQQQPFVKESSWVDGELPMLYEYGSTPENLSGKGITGAASVGKFDPSVTVSGYAAELLSSGEQTDGSGKTDNGAKCGMVISSGRTAPKPIPANVTSAPLPIVAAVQRNIPNRPTVHVPQQQQQQHQQAPVGGTQMNAVQMTPVGVPRAQSTPVWNGSEWICYPMMPAVPYFDPQLTSAVNYQNAVPSRDLMGADLPIHDVTTLRYFYNLGCDWFHQWSASQSYAPPVHFGAFGAMVAAAPVSNVPTHNSLPGEPILIEATQPPIMSDYHQQCVMEPSYNQARTYN